MRNRLLPLSVVVAGLFAATAQAQPNSVPAHSAPQAWVDYAGLVEHTFQARISGDTPTAQRLRAYLQKGGGDQITVAVSVWVDPKGVVSKIGFPAFLDDQANADFTALLQGAQLPGTPPAGILMPIHLRLHLGAGNAPAPQGNSSDK
jgi:hypothetical protein